MTRIRELPRSKRVAIVASASIRAARRAPRRSRWWGHSLAVIEQPFRGGAPGILLVEDNDEVALFMHEALEDAGYNVLCVATVAQAKRALRAGRFDLIVLDWNLDGACGSTLLTSLPSRDGLAWPPTIVTSGAAAKDQTISAIVDSGASKILRKPFGMKQLLQCVREATARCGKV